MKVVLLNTSELTGGAAVAANRLMKALRKSGVEASMLVRDRKTDDPHVVSIDDSRMKRRLNFLRFVWERLVILICNLFSRKNLFQVSIANTGTDLSKHPLVQEADVIHLHWINQGFLSLADIRKLINTGKPIVWTLHDMWPATAICHYPGECDKFASKCFRCPMMRRNPLFDLAYYLFNRKGGIGLSRVTFVGCSRWIMKEARKGVWLKSACFASIPNPIDTTVFNPKDKREARLRFGLPEDKILLLFAAAKLSDIRKGVSFFIEACGSLREWSAGRIEIVLMGNCPEEVSSQFPFKAYTLGYLSKPDSVACAYSCADMFVIPSLEDNLPNTIMEAMACGTPCVGFDTGGIPEMIDHQVNGYVAKRGDSADLARGIQWVIENREEKRLSEACVREVHERYRESVVAEQYIRLYRRLMKS